MLVEFRCIGRKRDGRPCRTLFGKGWIEAGYLHVICHKCNTSNVWGSESETVDSALVAVVN